ncbi:SnoaL-like domain-containing protein [Aquisalinus flavus]|uniref:SnoaL-like domain-containing protein n=1 Tax=Aquisalinus flavus TaxID=1526572 RepID=A0A8J2Y4T8_9PROT|nr:SnoaL-like domain-containing protein [Aquisalinus flavus]MBD0427606.1 nuclear transport factor 2 family protein [Aquisalinus flavus]UNE47394.1 nuclear transport factor 2 family protein [Aquisalinus flavus]GGD02339.1 hypothetical protein GCM10011342_09200 [Aquisalinus flavus]
MNDILVSTGNALVEHCRSHTEDQALRTLYHPDVISIEPMAQPGQASAQVHGLDALHKKHADWNENFETHDAGLSGPYFHGEHRFGIIFNIDATHKASGDRIKATEFALYTIDAEGKIIREEFFFNPALM